MLILLLGPVLVACEVVCPLIFTCSALDDTVCLNATENSVVVNNNPCSEYEASCNFRDITESIAQANRDGGSVTIYCESGRNSGFFDDLDERMDDFCTNEALYKLERLKNGQPLYECHTDEDCELENGDFANCTCANLVAKSFCELSYGDDIMDPIFAAACRNDTRMFRYYLAFKEAYLSSLNPPRCSLTLFENILYTSQIIEVGYDNTTLLLNFAGVVGLGLALALTLT
jgi:hypothetical protein